LEYEDGGSDADDTMNSSFDSGIGSLGRLASATSFQELVNEAARRQAAGMAIDAHNHQSNPLAPTAVASLHKLRTSLLSSSSFRSGNSANGNSANSSTHGNSMWNVQSQHRPAGLSTFSGRTGSFGMLGNAIRRRGSGSALGMGRRGSLGALGYLGAVDDNVDKNVDNKVDKNVDNVDESVPRRNSSMKNRKRPVMTGGRSRVKSQNKGRSSAKRRGSGITNTTISMNMSIPESHPLRKNISDKKKKNEDVSEPMERIKVLVAEDNKINQKVLKRTLVRVGINKEGIDIVENGKLAVEASDEKTYDIIFMDMQMPVMDGLEATSIISKRAVHPKIVFLTAHALSEYREKASEAGGDFFISKPFKMDAIRSIIDVLVLSGGNEEYSSEEEMQHT